MHALHIGNHLKTFNFRLLVSLFLLKVVRTARTRTDDPLLFLSKLFCFAHPFTFWTNPYPYFKITHANNTIVQISLHHYFRCGMWFAFREIDMYMYGSTIKLSSIALWIYIWHYSNQGNYNRRLVITPGKLCSLFLFLKKKNDTSILNLEIESEIPWHRQASAVSRLSTLNPGSVNSPIIQQNWYFPEKPVNVCW